jgi:SAM-dependent methyltransferase
VTEVEAWLDRRFIDAPGAALRQEDRKKAVELAALVDHLDRLVARRDVTIVDAAAGKGYVGLLLAERHPRARVVLVEREPGRLAAARRAAAAAGTLERCTFVIGDVREGWPPAPDVVVALHACGPAADGVLEAAVAARARHLLLVPCCTPAGGAGKRLADDLGLPRQAAIRRPFLESIVAAERTLRLEAAGYVTEIVPFVPPTVTPYNLLWRARRVGEARRTEAAAAGLARLRRG